MFQEGIHCLERTPEFTEAIQKVTLMAPDQKSPKELYVLSQAILAQIQGLERHKQQLLSKPQT